MVLFNDCFMTYNYPNVGRAAVELLEHLGCEVVLADKVCCGRPMISKGLVEDARRCAKHNVEALKDYAAQNIPIVGCEPSCLLTLRDEYLDLLKGEAVKTVARQSFMVEEWLGQDARKPDDGVQGRSTTARCCCMAIATRRPILEPGHWCAA